jgi:hypothetical protein
MTLPTEETVSSRPQKVPSRPEEDQQPGQVAQHLAALVEPDRDRFEQGGGLRGRQGVAGERRAHRIERAEDLLAQQRRAVRIGRQPHRGAGLGMDAPELAQGDEDADQERADDQAVQARIGHEGGDEPALQDEGEEAEQRQEDEGPDEVAQRAGEALDLGGRPRRRARPVLRPGLRRGVVARHPCCPLSA